MEPEPLPLGDVGDRLERVDRSGVRGPRARAHQERAHARRAILPDLCTERDGVHPQLVVGGHDPHVSLREARDRGGLGDARVRLLADVVRAVEEVLAELRVARRHHGREVRHRAAREQQPLRLRRVVEEVAQPAHDVLLDLHRRGARLPQPDVAVHALRHEVGERGAEEPAARDVGEVAGARVLERVRDGVAAPGPSARRSRPRLPADARAASAPAPRRPRWPRRARRRDPG